MEHSGSGLRKITTLVALVVLILVLVFGLLEAAGIPILSASARFERRQARAAVTLIMLEATANLRLDLSSAISAAVQAAGLDLPSLYDAFYGWNVVRFRRLGPAEYRVWVEISVGGRCWQTEIRTVSLVPEPPTPDLELRSKLQAECSPYQQVVEGILDAYRIVGCDEVAEFRVVIGEPPTVIPENACAQTLYYAANR